MGIRGAHHGLHCFLHAPNTVSEMSFFFCMFWIRGCDGWKMVVREALACGLCRNANANASMPSFMVLKGAVDSIGKGEGS